MPQRAFVDRKRRLGRDAAPRGAAGAGRVGACAARRCGSGRQGAEPGGGAGARRDCGDAGRRDRRRRARATGSRRRLPAKGWRAGWSRRADVASDWSGVLLSRERGERDPHDDARRRTALDAGDGGRRRSRRPARAISACSRAIWASRRRPRVARRGAAARDVGRAEPVARRRGVCAAAGPGRRAVSEPGGGARLRRRGRREALRALGARPGGDDARSRRARCWWPATARKRASRRCGPWRSTRPAPGTPSWRRRWRMRRRAAGGSTPRRSAPGRAAAALTVSRPGAFAALPSREELAAIIARGEPAEQVLPEPAIALPGAERRRQPVRADVARSRPRCGPCRARRATSSGWPPWSAGRRARTSAPSFDLDLVDAEQRRPGAARARRGSGGRARRGPACSPRASRPGRPRAGR